MIIHLYNMIQIDQETTQLLELVVETTTFNMILTDQETTQLLELVVETTIE